jgi:hypothetical protein
MIQNNQNDRAAKSSSHSSCCEIGDDHFSGTRVRIISECDHPRPCRASHSISVRGNQSLARLSKFIDCMVWLKETLPLPGAREGGADHQKEPPC